MKRKQAEAVTDAVINLVRQMIDGGKGAEMVLVAEELVLALVGQELDAGPKLEIGPDDNLLDHKFSGRMTSALHSVRYAIQVESGTRPDKLTPRDVAAYGYKRFLEQRNTGQHTASVMTIILAKAGLEWVDDGE